MSELVRVVITIHPSGEIHVNGPIAPLAWYLEALEEARKSVQKSAAGLPTFRKPD